MSNYNNVSDNLCSKEFIFGFFILFLFEYSLLWIIWMVFDYKLISFLYWNFRQFFVRILFFGCQHELRMNKHVLWLKKKFDIWNSNIFTWRNTLCFEESANIFRYVNWFYVCKFFMKNCSWNIWTHQWLHNKHCKMCQYNTKMQNYIWWISVL